MSANQIDNKRIAINTLFLYVQSICMLLVGLYTSRVTLHLLGVSDFGVYNAVAGVISTFSLLTGSMTTASQRFITYALGEGDSLKIKNVFDTCMTVHLILGIVVVVLMEIIGVWLLNTRMMIPEESLISANFVLQISILVAFINVICVPYDAIIIAYEKMQAFAYIGIFEGLLKLALISSLALFNSDRLILYSVFLLLIMLSKRVIYTIYTKKHFAEAKHINYSLNRTISKDLFHFVGWNMIGSSAAVLRNSGMDIVLNVFFGVLVNAAKGVCNQVQGAVMQLVNVFQTAVNPQLIKSIADKNYQRNHSLLIKGTKISFFLLLLISVPILLCTEELLAIWLVEVPEFSVVFIRLTLVCLWMETLSTYLSTNIIATGNIKNFQLIVGGTKLLVLPISYILLKFFNAGPTIGFVVNIILDFLCLGIRLLFNYKRVSLSISSFIIDVFIKCLLVTVSSLVTCMVLKYIIGDKLLLLLIFSVSITIFNIWLYGLSSGEKEYIKKLLVKKIVRQ